MPFYEDYETFRNQIYTGSDYQPDAYLGEQLNQSERKLMDELLSSNQWQHSQPDPSQITSSVRHSPDGMGHLEFDDPLVNAYAQVAYSRTAAHFAPWRQGPVYPDDPTVLNTFPGVDPQGKYCAKDMEFGQRLTRLMDTAALTNPQRHPALINAFEALKNPSGPLKALLENAQDTFKTVRETEHAAKVCPNQMTADLLETHAKNLINQSESVRKLDQYYTALEHIAGLRQNEPTPEVLATANELGLPTGLVAQSAPQAQPQSLKVEFQNFDHMMQQRMFSHPSNWGRSPAHLEAEPNNAQALEPYISRYAAATVHTTLEAMYRGKEDQTLSPSTNTRGTMIVVDGMTVEERMAAEHKQLGESQPYDQWYAQNVKQKTAEYVAAGLMAGKRVEAYIPKADGTLSTEPIRLGAQGYTPSPQKPKTLNAWQSFWSKFGFYKGKVTQAQEDQRSLEARDRLHVRYTAARMDATGVSSAKEMYEEMFFGDYFRQHGMNSSTDFANTLNNPSPGTQIPYLRTSYASLCIGLMAAQDIPIEDIMDPNKLKQEKQMIGRMLLDRFAVNPATGREGTTKDTRLGDPAWLGRMYFTAQQGLLHQLNRTMQGVDLRDDARMRQVMPAFNVASHALFDTYQDVSLVPGAYAAYSELIGGSTPNQHRQLTDRFTQNIYRASSASVLISASFRARGKLDTCSTNLIADNLSKYAQGIAVINEMADTPGKTFTQRVPAEHFLRPLPYEAIGNDTLMVLAQAAQNKPEVRKTVSNMAQTGKLADAMNIRMVPQNGRYKLTMAPADTITKAVNATQKTIPAPQMGRK